MQAIIRRIGAARKFMGPLSDGKTTGTWEAFYLIAKLRFKAARKGGIRSAQPVLAWL
jgi:hypothetical protein